MATMTVLNIKALGIKTEAELPADCVYIGRAMYRSGYCFAKSKWANPFKIDRGGTREEVIAKYRARLLATPELLAALPELRGKRLACWCAPERCHGDVLLELENGVAPTCPSPNE